MTRKEIILTVLNGAPAGMTCGEICKAIVKLQNLTGSVARYLSGSVSSKLNKLVKAGTLQYSTAKGPRGGYVYQLHVKKVRKVNTSWAFWKPIIVKKNGTINVTQLKKELADFSHILEQVPKVYMDITGGTLSKPNYFAADVINVADERYKTLWHEEFKAAILEMKKNKVISAKAYAAITSNFDSYL